MGDEKHQLLENFPHIRVFFKAVISFVAIAAAMSAFKDIWKPVDDLKTWYYEHDYATPLTFIAYYSLVLVVEAINRSQRLEMESRRSSPLLNRQARRAEERRRAREQKRRR